MAKPLTRSDWLWVLKVGGTAGIIGCILVGLVGAWLFPSRFERLDSKYDEVGHQATLYLTPDPVPIPEICALCRRDSAYHFGTRYYVAFFFDDPAFARFPNAQIVTGGYSPWDEQETMRHVKAVYRYNGRNRVGELLTYEKNQLESAAVVRKIP